MSGGGGEVQNQSAAVRELDGIERRAQKRSRANDDDDGAPIPEELMCSVCTELMTEPVPFTCGHALCAGCVVGLFGASTESKSCPQCRAVVRHEHAFRIDDATKKAVPAINTYVRNAFAAAIGTERFERHVRLGREAVERVRREKLDAMIARVSGAIHDSPVVGVSVDTLMHVFAGAENGPLDVERALVPYVRDGTFACTRAWFGVDYTSVDADAQLCENYVTARSAVYYLPDNFVGAVTSVFRTVAARRPQALRESIVPDVLMYAARVAAHPDRYHVSASRAVSNLAGIIDVIDANKYHQPRATSLTISLPAPPAPPAPSSGPLIRHCDHCPGLPLVCGCDHGCPRHDAVCIPH